MNLNKSKLYFVEDGFIIPNFLILNVKDRTLWWSTRYELINNIVIEKRPEYHLLEIRIETKYSVIRFFANKQRSGYEITQCYRQYPAYPPDFKISVPALKILIKYFQKNMTKLCRRY